MSTSDLLRIDSNYRNGKKGNHESFQDKHICCFFFFFWTQKWSIGHLITNQNQTWFQPPKKNHLNIYIIYLFSIYLFKFSYRFFVLVILKLATFSFLFFIFSVVVSLSLPSPHPPSSKMFNNRRFSYYAYEVKVSTPKSTKSQLQI